MRLMIFRDLRAERIVKTRTTLKKRIEEEGFPPGRLNGPYRVWTDEEVYAWVLSRPSDKVPPKGAVADMTPEGIAARVAKAMATKAAKKAAA
jgi:hypothetical protein